MKTGNFIDVVIVAAYVILSFVFGVFARKFLHSEKKDEENYFLAGRKMPGWLNGISYAVTAINADVAPGYCGMAVVVGLSACWLSISRFGLGLMVMALLFAVRWRQMGISTGPEFFSLRYSQRGGKFVRVYSSVFSVLFCMIPFIGTGLLGIHMIFSPIFGIESKVVTLSIILPTILIYVWISGFAGVLVTDFIQAMVIICANILLMVMILIRFGGPDGLVSAVQSAHPVESGDILSLVPVPGHRVFGPLTVIAWFFVMTIGFGGRVQFEGQRLFSCRDTREAAKVCIWAEIVMFVMLLLLTLPALAALVDNPELYHADPAERETCYGLLLSDYLPVGLLGIALAAIASSVMSTVDTHLNYGAQTLLNDVYRPLLGEPPEKWVLWIGRFLMIGILLAAIGVVFFAKSLMGVAVVLFGLLASAATFNWGQWWWWRVNIWSWVSAYVAGPVVYFSLGFLLKHVDWWQQQVLLGESQAHSMGMLMAIISMFITTCIWIIVTLLTEPEDMESLKAFYIKVRPMGLWKPVRVVLEKEGAMKICKPRNLILGGFTASVLGASWVAMAIFAASELFVGRYLMAVVFALVSFILAFLFKRMFNWHLKRMAL